MNDPHATLNLFEPRQVEEEAYHAPPTGQRAQSAKPPPRDLTELFVGEEPGSPSPGNNKSPHKERIPTKSGGGKNYKPNRLFDQEEEPAATPQGIKTSSKKYNHFEFGHGDEDDEATPKVKEQPKKEMKKSKHQSQWDFEDFVTPDKPKTKVLPAAVRHFGWSDDEVGPYYQPDQPEIIIVV
jgi:hypothetical protein